MKRLLDQWLGERTCGEEACRDTSAAERRHERAMREGETTLQRAERSIMEAIRQIHAAHEWEELFGRDDGGRP